MPLIELMQIFPAIRINCLLSLNFRFCHLLITRQSINIWNHLTL